MAHHALYFSPNLITARYAMQSTKRSNAQISAFRQNFDSNQYKGKVSPHTAKKIRKAVQWLVYLAPLKNVTCPESKRTYNYRAGLATISLPSGADAVKPEFFRKVLLTAFLDAARYKFGLRNYIWKIERQGNGRLHAHITIDQFLPWQWLNETWNEILKKHGLLEDYHERFSAMTRREYINHRIETDHKHHKAKFNSHLQYIKSLVKAHQVGIKNNWYRPNTTDVHSVKNVRNLAGYMVKYLSKDPNIGDDWKGRFWACSHQLSKLRSCIVYLPEAELKRFSELIEPATKNSEELFFYIEGGQDVRFYGCLYFLRNKLSQLMQCQPLRDLRRLIQKFYHQNRLKDLPFLKFQWQNGQYHLLSFQP